MHPVPGYQNNKSPCLQRDGYVQTFPVFSTGSKLILNVKCEPGGSVAVDVMDNWGNVWPGFSRHDCDVFAGDAVNHVVSWKDRTDVNTIPGLIKFRIHLKRAELFSFGIADE